MTLDTEEGSCGLQGKLVLIGGLVYRKLYHLMKIERFKNMFLEHVCVFFFFVVCLFVSLFVPRVPITLYSLTLKQDLMTLYVFCSDQKREK